MSANDLVFSLASDGSSDRMLVQPLTWLLGRRARMAFRFQEVRIRDLPKPPQGLEEKIHTVIELSGCDLLFVHRDAERESRQPRVEEIRAAVGGSAQPHVPVVPVRMTEAWFLFDEPAIRRAAGNPAGTAKLSLPGWNRVEEEPDPKEVLFQALRDATELSSRRLKGFLVYPARQRLAELIIDYEPLLRLSAFQHLDSDLLAVLRARGWHRTS